MKHLLYPLLFTTLTLTACFPDLTEVICIVAVYDKPLCDSIEWRYEFSIEHQMYIDSGVIHGSYGEKAVGCFLPDYDQQYAKISCVCAGNKTKEEETSCGYRNDVYQLREPVLTPFHPEK